MKFQKLDCNSQFSTYQNAGQSRRMVKMAAAIVRSFVCHVLFFVQWKLIFRIQNRALSLKISGNPISIPGQSEKSFWWSTQRPRTEGPPPHNQKNRNRKILCVFFIVRLLCLLLFAPLTASSLTGLRTFVDYGVDVAILEVGIGGRLDATNVIPPPVVAGITSLGFDHMDMLGNTLEVRSRWVTTHTNKRTCRRIVSRD